MKLFGKQTIKNLFSCYSARVTHVDCEMEKSVSKFSSKEINIVMDKATPIGEGGFSTVYLANLPNSSSVAAFKVQRSSERLDRIFHQELDILLEISHRHIVPFLGYCVDRDEGVLVFEYVANGTLHDRLHAKNRVPLSWSTRMSVAFQLASALEYLHDLQIIHGDIKSSNVLLDEKTNVKLCDFGSAKKGFSSMVDRACRNAMVGSPGYVDPCYFRTGMLTKKSDVYSFGVILLELVTGMETFGMGNEQMLTAVVKKKLQRGVESLVDPSLRGNYEMDEAIAIVEVAMRCINVEQTALRPSMGEVGRIMREKMKLVL